MCCAVLIDLGLNVVGVCEPVGFNAFGDEVPVFFIFPYIECLEDTRVGEWVVVVVEVVVVVMGGFGFAVVWQRSRTRFGDRWWWWNG